MYYSFDFASNVSRLCMDEIRTRGLQERKIFKKSVPNSGLFIKVFNKRTCTREDLICVNIHSVATLMQDALWSTPDRIISKKAWRSINYETCTLSNLSPVIANKGERLLIDILDFLVELMQHKSSNLMDAYRLGDALGKVVLGPADCDSIMAEKAGHFLTKLIIEHAKIQHQRQNKRYQLQQQIIHRIDSGFDYSPSYSCHSFYSEHRPICKAQGTQARAKFYNRAISKTKSTNLDWIENTIGVQALLNNDYNTAPEPPEKPWISIFTSADALMKPHRDMISSPTLYRILREAIRPKEPPSSDPFAASYLFDKSKMSWAESQISQPFTEFLPDQSFVNNYNSLYHDFNERSSPLQKLNHSISNLKINMKKYRSKHDLVEESMISEETDATMFDSAGNYQDIADYQEQKPSVRNVMKKMIKMGGISSQHTKEHKQNKIFI